MSKELAALREERDRLRQALTEAIQAAKDEAHDFCLDVHEDSWLTCPQPVCVREREQIARWEAAL